MLRTSHLAASLALLLSAGCGHDLALKVQEADTVQVFVLGTTATSRVLAPSSPEFRQLQLLVAQNRKGWSQLYSTPPATGILVTAGELHLQFIGSSVLASTPSGVFTKPIAESEYSFLVVRAGT